MMLSFKFVAGLLLSGPFVLALPNGDVLAATLSTCGPTGKTIGIPTTFTRYSTIVSTIYDTVMVEYFTAVPYSCYTRTLTTSTHSGNDCTTYSCPARPDCMIMSTSTITVPLSDACCTTTPTVTTTVQGPCSTCGTGCYTAYTTSTVTAV